MAENIQGVQQETGFSKACRWIQHEKVVAMSEARPRRMEQYCR